MITKIKYENFKHKINSKTNLYEEYFSENESIEIDFKDINIFTSSTNSKQEKSNKVGKSMIIHSIRYLINPDDNFLIEKNNNIVESIHQKTKEDFIFTFNIHIMCGNLWIKRTIDWKVDENKKIKFKKGKYFYKERESEWTKISSDVFEDKYLNKIYESWPTFLGPIKYIDKSKKKFEFNLEKIDVKKKNIFVSPSVYLNFFDRKQSGTESNVGLFSYGSYYKNKSTRYTILNSFL